MKKQLFIILAIIISICIFTACDESSIDETSASEPGSVEASAPSSSDDPETTEPPHEHAWSAWTVTLNATCTTEGTEERTCDCGEKETQAIAPLDHTIIIDEAIPATCLSEGKTEGKHCAVCNEILIPQYDTETLDHKEEIIPGLLATCTESGITDGKKCTVCNTVTIEQTPTEPLGHTYGDWEIVKKATKTEDGSKQKFCTVCRISGESKTIYATGSEGLIFELCENKESYFLKSGTNCTDPIVIIPLMYNDLPVIGISPRAFAKSKSLQEISIPDQITTIGNEAFSNCESLTNVTLPKHLITIEAHTFHYCKKLKKINIPNSVQRIGGSAFDNCTALDSISFGSELKVIAGYAFDNCINLKNITFSDCDAVINSYAFSNSPNIRKITFLGGLKEIRHHAFDCTGYTPNYNKSLYIYDLAAYCSIKMGMSPLNVSTSGPGISKAEGYIYVNGKLISELVIPDGITSIPDHAFSYSLNIKSVKLPNTVNNIGNDAFSFCKNLTNISFSNNLNTIGESAFRDCYSLKSIIIPEGVTHIRDYAFYSCNNLENISFPNTLISIGSIFYDCNKLKYNLYEGAGYLGNKNNPYLALAKSNTETIHPQTRFILSDAFKHSEIKNIVLSDGIISIGNSAFMYCKQLEEISLPNSLESIGHMAFQYCEKLSSITIPDSVTLIGFSAFQRCSNLKSIKLSNNITKIPDGMFEACISLKEIIIPEGVTSIEYYAFGNCTSLSNIILPNSLEEVDRAFVGCTALELKKYDNAYYIGSKDNPYMVFVKLANNSSTSCELHPNTIILGGRYFFLSEPKAKNIKSFTIPRNIIYIPRDFFNGCTNLTDITFEGTIAEWENLPKDRSWDHGAPLETIHCTDGDIRA